MKYRYIFTALILFIAVSIAVLVCAAKPGNELACGSFGYLNSQIFNSNDIEVSPNLQNGVSVKFLDYKSGEWIDVYGNGKRTNPIPYHHGLNTFRVIRDGKAVLSFEHVKENNWYSHKYEITSTGNSINYKIIGCGNAGYLPSA